MITVAEFRAQFPVTKTRSYLFSGAIAPAAASVHEEMERWIEAWKQDPLVNYDRAFDDMSRLRGALGAVLGVAGSQVSLSENTSRASNTGVRLLMSAIPGSNVVVDRTTYPSSRYPWMAYSGAEIRVAPHCHGEPAWETIERCADDETIAIVVSHVCPRTGFRHDLEPLADIAKRHGAALMVDLAQSAGAVPLPPGLEGIDVAVGTTMKWLLGPPGIGYLYVRSGLSDLAKGLDVGYVSFSVDQGRWPESSLPDRVKDSRMFEVGIGNIPGLGAAVAGIELIQEVGIEAIFEQVSELSGRCVRGLTDLGLVVRTPADARERGGVVAFETDEAYALAAYSRANGIDVGGYRWGLGRVDPHGFNDVADVERFLAGARAFFALSSTERRSYGPTGTA